MSGRLSHPDCEPRCYHSLINSTDLALNMVLAELEALDSRNIIFTFEQEDVLFKIRQKADKLARKL